MLKVIGGVKRSIFPSRAGEDGPPSEMGGRAFKKMGSRESPPDVESGSLRLTD
jgi:hypothetical protein